MFLDKEVLQILRQYLERFKDLTINLIDCLEKEQYESLESLFNDRQAVIDDMSKLSYTKESFKYISSEMQLMPLQQKLTLLMNKRRAEVKQELDKLSASKTASKSYNTKYKVDALFFNKKI
ncbi:flagellar protein FliT [Clostridium swellfunianum]|uniref:flagellar protein FliT n=1 Tax=Clostridium swellfunianum TaxID=1367462 RepID=UPI00202E0C8D|nr:flagellar protein FliT [Clostridium swellfunianum]MCM0650458.1 flagellar protein FliT [Clostridium swellfunianum]